MVKSVSAGVLLALSALAMIATPTYVSANLSTPKALKAMPDARETYTGTIVGVGGAAGGRTWNFTMSVKGYTTQGEALEYAQLLQSQGQDDLLKAIGKRDLGTFSVAGQIGRNLNFVYQVPSEGGRRIVALFDRWESTWERRSGARTLDYPFTYVEFSVDPNGKGSGTLIPLAKIYFDKKDSSLVNVENFGVYPLRLVNIERES
jgi:hypothetical protein